MSDHGERRFRIRARLTLAVMGLGLVGVGLRAGQLQVSRFEELSRLSRNEYLKDVRVAARRGHIYDRNGKPMAISVTVPSVFANPSVMDDPRQAARQLAKVLDMNLDTIYRRLASDRLFVWLKRQVSPAVAARVAELKIPGVDITKESKRFFPNRELGAHVVGFTGVDVRGLEGIEREFDTELTGAPRVVAALRDARGRAVLAEGLEAESESRGSDIRLTIDLRVQHAAQIALQRAVEKTKAKAGVAVVLDVPSSEVLAMAISPAFNPNRASRAPAAARRNRVVTDMFEPGSSLKPLVIAAALDAGVIKRDTKVFCENGALAIGGNTIRDSRPHGWLDVSDVIALSSNVGAAKIGQALGRDKLFETLTDLGFGRRTGIRFPGETSGLVRPPDSWSRVGIATISFGQGLAVSGLQLAAAYRVLANGGYYDPPVLVRQIERATGTIDVPSRPAGHRVFAKRIAEWVLPMMEKAASPQGTGRMAMVPGYRVAGKTGTAQKIDPVAGGYSSDRFIAVFSGLVPVPQPRAVIVVAVDEPRTVHTGGAVSAPVFAEIAEATMRYLGVVPTEKLEPVAAVDPSDPPVEVEPVEAEPLLEPTGPAVVGSGQIPSFLGMSAREALARYAELGASVNLELEGSGLVVGQEPPAGAQQSMTQRIKLKLSRR